MNQWGPATYGDPCGECGFVWSLGQDDAMRLVAEIPTSFSALLEGCTGREQHPDLDWDVSGYVSHVVDNLRIWAERLAGLATGDRGPVAPYDERMLGDARAYAGIGVHGALWSLDRAAADWTSAVELAIRSDVVLEHPERGRQEIVDVVRSNAHDAYHHRWDIQRILAANAR